MQYSIEPKTRKYVKGYGYLLFARKYNKKTIGYKTRCCKNYFKKIIHKAGEFIENKIADVKTKSNDDNIDKQELVGEIIIQSEKRDEILNKLRKAL